MAGEGVRGGGDMDDGKLGPGEAGGEEPGGRGDGDPFRSRGLRDRAIAAGDHASTPLAKFAIAGLYWRHDAISLATRR
jgi:hypothetical protein